MIRSRGPAVQQAGASKKDWKVKGQVQGRTGAHPGGQGGIEPAGQGGREGGEERKGMTEKCQGFQRSWCLPIPC